MAEADSFMGGPENDECHLRDGDWSFAEMCVDVASCDATTEGHILVRPFRNWGVVLIGIYSKPRAVPCESNRVNHSFYTRVSNISRWITSTVGNLKRIGISPEMRTIKAPVLQ